MKISEILKSLNINEEDYQNKAYHIKTPIDGSLIGSIDYHDEMQYRRKITSLRGEFHKWCDVPAPKRGQLIRLFGNQLRKEKENLAQLVTLESGKTLIEARGEVQEMIDICDFAVGLSRQLYGLTIASERQDHNMYETYYPIGIVGIISAFNFPVAVWAWNFALAIICGNVCVWKPSEKTPFSAIAANNIFKKACSEFKEIYPTADKLSEIIISDKKIAKIIAEDNNINLVSATGSCNMGRKIAPKLAARFAKSILELGGNNAAIVTKNANLDLAVNAISFGAIGTAGQRCTSTRRVFVERNQYEEFCKKIRESYEKLIKESIGDPREEQNLIGPLISIDSGKKMESVLNKLRNEDAKIFFGNRILEDKFPNAYYVEPAICEIDEQIPIIREEIFVPILYIMPYDNLSEAILYHNAVPQGLSSSIFTNNIQEAEFFRKFSDCGIANVNIGTSGAEIGGAFGGEKETGGGRESGSDCWKNYMRRQTSTIYYGEAIPELAQNVKFKI
jgi:aldehyde dehydrogenase (NAD+)